MKRILFTLCVSLATMAASQAQTKAIVYRKSKEFFLNSNIREDHKIFGYAAANVKSKKLILFSVFTNDVKDNPYKCPLGAYYETSGLKSGDKIRFISESAAFVKLTYLTSANVATLFYIERKFVDFQ